MMLALVWRIQSSMPSKRFEQGTELVLAAVAFDQECKPRCPVLEPVSGGIGPCGKGEPFYGQFVSSRLTGLNYPFGHASSKIHHPVGMAGVRCIGETKKDFVGRIGQPNREIDGIHPR